MLCMDRTIPNCPLALKSVKIGMLIQDIDTKEVYMLLGNMEDIMQGDGLRRYIWVRIVTTNWTVPTRCTEQGMMSQNALEQVDLVCKHLENTDDCREHYLLHNNQCRYLFPLSIQLVETELVHGYRSAVHCQQHMAPSDSVSPGESGYESALEHTVQQFNPPCLALFNITYICERRARSRRRYMLYHIQI